MNKQTRNIVITAVCSVLATAFACFLAFFMYNALFRPAGSAANYSDKLAEIQSYIDRYAIYDFNESVAEDYVYSGYVYGLEDDMYCAYYNADAYADIMYSREGNFTGIGITVKNTEDISEGLFVYRVIGNSPAESAGLRPCDRIVSVDGQDITTMTYEQAVDMLLGAEGSAVTVGVRRGGSADTPAQDLEFDMLRQDFVQREVDYSQYDGLGYIQIHNFTSVAEDEFAHALTTLISAGVEGFIFDVRNNPGGNLDTVEHMLDMLMPEGEPIIFIESKDGQTVEYSTGSRISDLPCVVLINSDSASASELFSSTLRDVCGAELIGTQSYGKAIGQRTFRLSDGSGLKLTTFRYFTKSRTDFNGIGLVPDEVVTLNEDETLRFYSLTREQDAQFMKAAEVLKGKIEKGE